MLLQDLFEDMSINAVDQLLYNVNLLTMLHSDTLPGIIKNMYAEGNHEDMWRTTKKVAGQQKGRWFAENFLSTSSRRINPTTGMKNALITLSKDSRYKKNASQLKELGGVEINMDVAVRQEKGISYSKYVDIFAGELPMLLKSMASDAPLDQQNRLKVAASRLENAVNAFENMWLKLQEAFDRDWGKKAPESKAKQKAPSMGQQLSQADMIINQVLGDLDKKVAHEIRMKLAKTDNKLLVLQQELNSRGIQM
jgi:hypothetical protein